MKKINSTALITIFLLIFSVGVFIVQIFIFKTPRDTGFYLLQDLAFLPLQVALVTIILGKVLSEREKRERLKKTNMMLGAFFSEIGDEMLVLLNRIKTSTGEFKTDLKFKENWSGKDFKKAAEAIEGYKLEISCSNDDFQSLKSLLSAKRGFLLIMLSNPNLMEHESFTDLLWAIFHLTDELISRNSLEDLPENDRNHLNNDVKRAYNSMLSVWIIYMAHLKTDYPYLFSLELRKNPFEGSKNIIIK